MRFFVGLFFGWLSGIVMFITAAVAFFAGVMWSDEYRKPARRYGRYPGGSPVHYEGRSRKETPVT